MQDTRELRSFLLERMKETASGDLEIGRAKAICNLAQQIYNTCALEIKAAKAFDEVGADKVVPVNFNGHTEKVPHRAAKKLAAVK